MSTAVVPTGEEPFTEAHVDVDRGWPPGNRSIEAPEASGEPTVRFARCDLAEILRDSVGQASSLSPSVPVEIHAPQTLPAVVQAEALAGVVRILVDYACRRTDPGLSVTVKANSADEGIAVHVFERGTGIDPEEGYLDLARSLVALHGGVLWSEPLPAGGAKSSFVIPREPPALDGPDQAAAIRSLELLAQLDVQPSPVPPVEEEPEEAFVEVGLLEDARDEPHAILDVTDIPVAPTVEDDWPDPLSPPSDLGGELDLNRAAPEPPVGNSSDLATVLPEAEPPEPGLETEDHGPAAQNEDAEGRRPRRKSKRGRWGWRRPPRATNPPEDELAAAAHLESPPVTDDHVSKPDPMAQAPLPEAETEGPRDEPDPGFPALDDADHGAVMPPIEELGITDEVEDVQAVKEVPVAGPDLETGKRARPVHHVPVPFVPDPLHPATQMLRALLLDEEQRRP